MLDFNLLRDEMVARQLERRGIIDRRVLNAFRLVERHKFVPEDSLKLAYDDSPLAIGHGQTISQPYMVALMTEYLELTGQEKVLEIGTGSGYQCAILSRLAKEVYSIERIGFLVKEAIKRLESAGYANVNIKLGDGTLGWPDKAPFERIIITAATPQVPAPLVEQLSLGGRLVVPLGDACGQTLTIVKKEKNGLITEEAGGCVFVPLIGKYGYPD